ncbi:MAG TPA: murein biosynthesis integral membrane protein MurJ, partial [Dehalococcoidia bacterium]|nr:murein biosynthesis integral membrane protein MurJ [Dehalococcoidia bacterium]
METLPSASPPAGAETGHSGRLATSSLTFAALIVAAGFLGSRLLGLLRSVIIAEAFGTRPELDAYWVAFRLPDLVFQLLAGATLASAFIPTFAGVRARHGDAASWRLASSVLNLVLMATIIFAVAAFLLAPKLVPLLAPGLGEDTGREQELQDLAVELTRIMLVSPVLFAISGMFMGILNARRHFLMPALAPMFYNVSIIVAALVSDDVRALAVGVVVGAALHLAIQLPDLRFAGMAYRLIADWRDAAVREVGALMAPRVLGLAATQVNFYFIGIFFASTLSAGAISGLSFAWLITMTPLGIVGMAISTAAFPTLAEQAARQDVQFAATLRSALRLILFLSLPIGIGLAILAKPLVVVLLQRGAFGVESTDLTAQALMFYAPALFAHSGIEIVSRGFYATGDTRTPVSYAVTSMLVNLVLAAILVGPMELRGLALALSLATSMEFLLLFFSLRRRIPLLVEADLLDGIARMLVATAAMAIVVGGGLFVLVEVAGLSTGVGIDALVILVLCGGAGSLTYLGAAQALRLEETRILVRRFWG